MYFTFFKSYDGLGLKV